MKCPECVKAGKKSQVFPLGGTRTLMNCAPYYDEDGEYHHHDANTTTNAYRCSKGHQWRESSMGSCWCGWPKKKAEAKTPVKESN